MPACRYSRSPFHWHTNDHVEISGTFRLPAKRQRAGAVQDASRISGIIVSRQRFGIRRPAAALLQSLLKAYFLSFISNYYLTNRIIGRIHCAMTTSTCSPKANPRINRIRIVSRIGKIVMLGLLVFTLYRSFFFSSSSWSWSHGGVSLLEPSQTSSFFWYHITLTLFFIILLAWYWKLFRLFNLYEHGLIFSAQTIRCIKILGLLCAVGWILGNVLRV